MNDSNLFTNEVTIYSILGIGIKTIITIFGNTSDLTIHAIKAVRDIGGSNFRKRNVKANKTVSVRQADVFT